MSDSYRKDRIERLLHELQYEVTRGTLEKEIDETMTFRFVIGVSAAIPDGVVLCEFRTRPRHKYDVIGFIDEGELPRLKIVK